MFDTGQFDNMPFDRIYEIQIFGSFDVSMQLSSTMQIYAQYFMAFDVSQQLMDGFSFVRDKLASFLIEQSLSTDFAAGKESYGSFEVEMKLGTMVEFGKNRVEMISFVGEFTPGSKIIIDSDKLKFMMNNQNALHLMQGDFFDLNTGTNEILYTDDQSGRTVRLRLTHRDRFV